MKLIIGATFVATAGAFGAAGSDSGFGSDDGSGSDDHMGFGVSSFGDSEEACPTLKLNKSIHYDKDKYPFYISAHLPGISAGGFPNKPHHLPAFSCFKEVRTAFDNIADDDVPMQWGFGPKHCTKASNYKDLMSTLFVGLEDKPCNGPCSSYAKDSCPSWCTVGPGDNCEVPCPTFKIVPNFRSDKAEKPFLLEAEWKGSSSNGWTMEGSSTYKCLEDMRFAFTNVPDNEPPVQSPQFSHCTKASHYKDLMSTFFNGVADADGCPVLGSSEYNKKMISLEEDRLQAIADVDRTYMETHDYDTYLRNFELVHADFDAKEQALEDAYNQLHF